MTKIIKEENGEEKVVSINEATNSLMEAVKTRERKQSGYNASWYQKNKQRLKQKYQANKEFLRQQSKEQSKKTNYSSQRKYYEAHKKEILTKRKNKPLEKLNALKEKVRNIY